MKAFIPSSSLDASVLQRAHPARLAAAFTGHVALPSDGGTQTMRVGACNEFAE